MNDTTVQPHRGSLILVFGILSLMTCFVFGIVAWIMGKGDLARMADGTMDPSGEGLTRAGVILGIVAACLNLLAFLMVAMLVLGAGGMTAAQ